MKPPYVTPPPPGGDQVSAIKQQQQQKQPPSTIVTAISAPVPTPTTTSYDANKISTTNQAVTSQTMIASQQTVVTKPQTTIVTTQEQQAPLALITQSQMRPQMQTTTTAHIISQPVSQVTATTTQSPMNSQMAQAKFQPNQLQAVTTIAPQQPAQPIALAQAPSTTGPPTALVIIPQHSTTTSITTAKTAAISSKSATTPTTLAAAHIGHIATTTRSPTIQLQTPTATLVPNMAPVPMTAHQQSPALNQTTMIHRPPQTLPVLPITATSAAYAKQEPTKCTCCLIDNGVRCDRIACNASFSARIQKIVGTKKMNFAIDPAARHVYICDNHKAIITVAKKTANVTREPKSAVKMASSGFVDGTGGDNIPTSSGGVDVDLQQLQVNTLRRYKRHFRVQTRPGLNKMQLAEFLKSHFRTLPIIEKEAITYFVYIVKCYRNKLDHNPKAD